MKHYLLAVALICFGSSVKAQVTGGSPAGQAATTLSSLSAAGSGANTDLTSASKLATVSTPAGLAVTYDVRAASGSIGGVTINAAGSTTIPVAAVFTSSGPSYFNISIATVAAGAAGAAVTVACPANSFVMYGGCNCTGTEVGVVTGVFNGPSGTWTAGGSVQSGWKCQSTAVTTGQTCAGFVQCASIRN